MTIGSSRVLKNACLDVLGGGTVLRTLRATVADAIRPFIFEPMTNATVERCRLATETMLREVCERNQHGYSIDLMEPDPNDPSTINVSVSFRGLEPLRYERR